ncbi:MAG TPA: hypothetical protein VNM87_04380, partial [Candidatus Udaeobacter sp.]|nr:hypothetical protein [Candidatus Udaeobacter sp.]
MGRTCVAGVALLITIAGFAAAEETAPAAPAIGPFPGEKHLQNIRQLTFGGENAEGYFAPDGRWLVFQSTRDSLQCDQIFRMNADGSEVRRISNGLGRTTCAFVMKGAERILYASTYLADPKCPPPPDRS